MIMRNDVALFQSTPCKHPVIVLQDVAFSDLHALVEFIYHGEVNVHQRSLSSFLKTAEVLRVSGLTQQADQPDRDEVRPRIKLQGLESDVIPASLRISKSVARENDDFCIYVSATMETCILRATAGARFHLAVPARIRKGSIHRAQLPKRNSSVNAEFFFSFQRYVHTYMYVRIRDTCVYSIHIHVHNARARVPRTLIRLYMCDGSRVYLSKTRRHLLSAI